FSAAVSSAREISPREKRSRSCRRPFGRNRLPMCSARKGGFSRVTAPARMFMAGRVTSQEPARHRSDAFVLATGTRLRRRYERGVERTIGTDRARLVLARKIPCQPGNKLLGSVSVSQQNLDDVLNRHCIVVRMPTIEVGHHGDGGVTNLGLPREFGLG